MISTASYTSEALGFAEDVLSGRRPANQWLKKAAARQLADLDRYRSGDIYRFDEGKVERVCAFVEAMPHVKGRWARARQPLALEAWQVFILACVFGWVKPDGTRRFRTVLNLIPRKNAKSTLTSAVALYMLAADGEAGAEVYSAATNYEQAAIVWRDARTMVEKSPEFAEAFNVETNTLAIYSHALNSRFVPLGAADKRLDGLNPSFSVLDEVHAMANRGLYDVLDTAMGARSQPLLWLISTAGTDLAGICYEQVCYLEKVLDGVIVDETYFGCLFGIDAADDWQDETAWRKANPNFGVSVDPDDLARQAARAGNLPSLQSAFLTKRLNVWVNADSAWLNMNDYRLCTDVNLKLEDMAGRPCYIGLDLASRVDILAIAYLFPLDDGRLAHFGRYYLPEETIERSENSQYDGWVREGRLVAMEGAINDLDTIADDLLEAFRRFRVKGFYFDPFQDSQLLVILQKRGVSSKLLNEIRQTVQNLSPAMKELEGYIAEHQWRHDGCPITQWMFSNVVCHHDKKDNVYPNKQRPQAKIDGAIAALLGLKGYTDDQKRTYSYQERGLRTI